MGHSNPDPKKKRKALRQTGGLHGVVNFGPGLTGFPIVARTVKARENEAPGATMEVREQAEGPRTPLADFFSILLN